VIGAVTHQYSSSIVSAITAPVAKISQKALKEERDVNEGRILENS
jgi:hypothetical protein